MLAHLTGAGPDSGEMPDGDGYAITNAYGILGSQAAPEVRAAVFEALALLPEHDVVPGVRTLTGATGTAITATAGRGVERDEDQLVTRDELIPDPETYELLGYREDPRERPRRCR
jgi:hypothetical protein